MAQDGTQRVCQLRSGVFQFSPVGQHELPEDRTSDIGQPQKDLAFVFDTRGSRDCASHLKAVHQFNRAVVLNEKSGSDFTNRGLDALGKSVYGKQQLVLLRLDLVLSCDRFAGMEELPDLAAELGQILILIGR